MKNLAFKNSHKIFKKKPFLININEPKKKCKNNLLKKIRDINNVIYVSEKNRQARNTLADIHTIQIDGLNLLIGLQKFTYRNNIH